MEYVKGQYTPIAAAILVGSILISTSVLISGGVIRWKQSDNSQSASAETTTNTVSGSLEDKLVAISKEVKVDSSKFKSCLTSQKFKDEINKDQQDAQSAGITGTPGFIIGRSSADGKINGVKIAGAYPPEVFKTIFDKLSVNTPVDQIPDLTIQQSFPSASGADLESLKNGITTGTASVDGDPILGDKNAQITMIEFSDYECPFCKRHFQQTLPELKKNYFDTGKVKLVFRDFIAIPQHNPTAITEALAAECVKDQGGDTAYYQYHDIVFSKTQSNGVGIP